jgi:prepilin-type N-terminal cleavage/methylation domain-containing protein
MVRASHDIRRGVTFFEILLAMGIIAILSAIIFPNLQGRRAVVEFEVTVGKIATLLREAQSTALSGNGGVDWGVHFENNADNSFFSLFSDVYGSGEIKERIVLPAGISYDLSGIPLGGSKEIVFDGITGRPTIADSIIIKRMNGAIVAETAVISIGVTGAVSYAITF